MITVNSIPERREAVTAINDFDDRTGMLKSQRAKYEKPLWFYILAILCGKDQKRCHSVQCIVDILAIHNIKVSKASVNRTLKIMLDTNYHIHPHRRGCGVSCHEAVAKMGGLLYCKQQNNQTGLGAPVHLYFLGGNISSVRYWRRVFNIHL